MTFEETLVGAIYASATFNPYSEAAPVCVLWTDADRLFEPILGQLQARMPELFVLGDYSPDNRRGPAIWLRYMLDGGSIQTEKPPIFYLPGVSRAQLRPEDNCPFLLAPLCELVFRGKAWTHENSKDWTPSAFLMAQGIEVQLDAATKEALQRSLPKLIKSDLEALRSQMPISATVLNDLLNPEPVEALLGWMNDSGTWKAKQSPAEWTAFRETCKKKYLFNPEKDGDLRAAELLGAKQSGWESVWHSFAKLPNSYQGVIDLLGKVRTKKDDLFYQKDAWPQANEEGENALRKALNGLAHVTSPEAKDIVLQLEAAHGERRTWVWTQLGRSPLAQALEHLAKLAALAAKPLSGTTPKAVADNWTQAGWQCDAAALDALASVEESADWVAVKIAVRALYRDWLNEGAEHFAKAVALSPIEAGNAFRKPAQGGPEQGSCYLFADGLRYDVAQKLVAELGKVGLQTECDWQFGPLPGVTSTAKPLATPLPKATFFPAANLETRFEDRKVTADSLRDELKKNGFQILTGGETGQPQDGPAWTECGAFDSIGHGYGAQLAQRLDGEVRNLSSRVRTLLANGWQEVRITTDHGWMLLPGNLDKAHLPEHLTEVRKGRCARLKPGSTTEFQTVPWVWDSSVSIAMAPGARCFEDGKEYEHGGLSVQECVLPLLTVRSGVAKAPTVRLSAPVWKGFRCSVNLIAEVGSPLAGLIIDLRTKAADAATSLCDGGKAVTRDNVTLMISDEHRGTAANVVLLDEGGALLDKFATEVPDD